MLRRALLAASASTGIRELITTMPVSRDVVARFVAGETADDALAVISRLAAEGLLATVDYLGEEVGSREQAAAAADEYIALLGRLGPLAATAEVSVKPTAVGLGLPEHGEKTTLENIVRIAVAARNAATTVTLDMEDHTRVEATLRLVAQLRADFPDLGCVLQSYLRRTEADCAALAAAGARVRLCKGAYEAPGQLSGRQEIDRSYARCMRILMRGGGYPMLATHDPRLIELGGVVAAMAGRGRDEFEYQMLYGLRTAEQRRLAAAGARVRVYVPYGRDWYGYLVRRLAERPANLAFFLRALASGH
jgi:proline dehydrogenase